MKISSVIINLAGEAADVPVLGESMSLSFDDQTCDMVVTAIDGFTVANDDFCARITLSPAEK